MDSALSNIEIICIVELLYDFDMIDLYEHAAIYVMMITLQKWYVDGLYE